MMPRWFMLTMAMIVTLVSACSTASETPIPTVISNPAPTSVSENPTEAPTLVPSATIIVPTAFMTPTPIPITPSETPILVEPLAGVESVPPLTIELPENWQLGYDTLIYQEFDELTYLPFALYTGEVTGGFGTIVLLWNYRNITTGNPLSNEFGQTDVWVDALRLLRVAIFENACNFGTAPRDDSYQVGGRFATGSLYSVVDCPDLPDTRGWFVALEVDGMNFAFYMYTDPIEAMDGNAPLEMQAILDTIQFDVASFQAVTPQP